MNRDKIKEALVSALVPFSVTTPPRYVCSFVEELIDSGELVIAVEDALLPTTENWEYDETLSLEDNIRIHQRVFKCAERKSRVICSALLDDIRSWLADSLNEIPHQ